jgi:hypothetical protein
VPQPGNGEEAITLEFLRLVASGAYSDEVIALHVRSVAAAYIAESDTAVEAVSKSS